MMSNLITRSRLRILARCLIDYLIVLLKLQHKKFIIYYNYSKGLVNCYFSFSPSLLTSEFTFLAVWLQLQLYPSDRSIWNFQQYISWCTVKTKVCITYFFGMHTTILVVHLSMSSPTTPHQGIDGDLYNL